MPLKLYEAVDALATVEAWLEEHDDEIRAADGVVPDELAALLDEAEGALNEKVERIALLVRRYEVIAAAIGEEKKRLDARQKHFERAATNLKRYLLMNLERAGQQKIKGTLATVWTQKAPPAVKCAVPIPTLPEAFRIQPPQPPLPAPLVNRDAVLAAWKEKQALPDGITVEQSTYVRIG